MLSSHRDFFRFISFLDLLINLFDVSLIDNRIVKKKKKKNVQFHHLKHEIEAFQSDRLMRQYAV